MRIVDNYNYLPGCCWICRGVAKPIIDMELDLDGHNTPEDVNPSAITRLYICADCAVEIGRMMSSHRALELNKMGELALYKAVADELAAQIDSLEDKLESIASAINGVGIPRPEPVDFTEPADGEAPAPDSSPSEASIPLTRRRGSPRRKDKTHNTDLDFLGDL